MAQPNLSATKAHTGVLIVNLGTPDSPSVPDVRKYLREFLMDGRVIDIPYVNRFLLVNCIIAPFRAPKSAKVYKEVWTERGSPLKFYSEDLEGLLQNQLGPEYLVSLGMRYQSPSIATALDKLKNKGLERIIVVPLFPQYASATTGSVHDKVMELVRGWQIIPEMVYINSFFDHPLFIKAFTELGKRYMAEDQYDHIIFSYHGLPERQIRKGDCTNTCLSDTCCNSLHAMNRSCYRAQCFATSRLLAENLGLKPEDYTVCFQSRLGKDPWIQPYTEDVIIELCQKGKKRVLAFSPAFVADCLETTIEIGEEYKEVFEEKGGEHWKLVESLNVSPLWVDTLEDLVRNYQNLPKLNSNQPAQASVSI
jgi:protoporphyrin/coproporphyrin ferrochelatase